MLGKAIFSVRTLAPGTIQEWKEKECSDLARHFLVLYYIRLCNRQVDLFMALCRLELVIVHV